MASDPPLAPALARELSVDDAVALLAAVQELSSARDLLAVMAVVRRRARALTAADGVSFVLRDGDHCFYADEDAIAPLWKGRRFPADQCVSGWVMRHREAAAIPDIYADVRVPADAYRPTFVQSLAMVPVRQEDPIAAIGAYWAVRHTPTARQLALLQALANATAVAISNNALLRELRASERAKDEAIRARDEFLAIAAHELKTPLTALQLQVQGLLDRHRRGRSDDAVPRLERARQQVERLGALIGRLLDVSRLTTEGLVLDRARFDLRDEVRAAVERSRDAARAAGCELRIELPDAAAVGTWDRARIGQVLDTLVSNALKYGAGMPVTIGVELPADAGIAVLRVADGGIGLNPADHARVFGRFERAVPVRHYGGLGLGLYVADRIVHAHGGRLRVDSEIGRGATFTAELPIDP